MFYDVIEESRMSPNCTHLAWSGNSCWMGESAQDRV